MDAMINMASRTEPIAISPSCIKFSVSFPAPKGRFLLRAGCVVFTHYVSNSFPSREKNPFFSQMIS
jgi:hypothetical protein